jgi:hypothetical protein
MSNPRSSELALSNLTIGGDNSSGAFTPAVQVAAARGAFFRKAGITKADVTNDTQDDIITDLSTAVVNEASTARAAELSLATSVSTEESTARAAELSLGTAASAEASHARSAELVLTQNLSTEVVERNAAVSTCLVSANAYADQKITDLVNGAPQILDTLKELADALGNDGNFAVTIANNIATVSTALVNEVTRAESVELALSQSISTEVMNRGVAVTSEESTARAAELSLQVRFSTAVSAEASVSRFAETSLATAVSAEATTSRSAEASLTSRVSTETLRAVSAELSLTTSVTAEASVARSAELSLTSRVGTEKGRALAEEFSIGVAVSTEASTARAAELSLSTRVSTEESVARAAELSLTTRVSIEEAARATAIANAISTEVVDRNAAISVAASATLAGANQYTDGALSTEVVNRNAAVSVALASANSYTDGAVSSLSTALAQDIADLSGETSTNLAAAISTEVVSRNGAISSAVNNLSAAMSIALAEEASTARSAELSLASLLSTQVSTTTSNISAALSTNTASRLVYKDAADVKFNSIQQAFDVIFDAIDIEKYQGSAPDYFQYDATVQALGGAGAPAPAPAPPTVEGLNVTKSALLFNNETASLVRDTISDSNKNLYCIGTYTGAGTFEGDTFVGTLVSVNNMDGTVSSYTLPAVISMNDRAIFLIKYNEAGMVQWCTGFDSDTFGDSVFGLDLDSNNNVYICGRYIPSTNGRGIKIRNANGFNQVDSAITLPSTGSFSAAYLIKYNSSGVAQWATAIDGTHTSGHFDIGYEVKVDSANNVYMTGQYRSSVAITLKSGSGNGQVDSSVVLPISANAASYIVKYNTSGAVQWATLVDGTGNEMGLSIDIDSSDNVYATGYYLSASAITLKNASGNTQVNSSYTLPIAGSNSSYLVKYNSSGAVQWATNFRGNTATNPNKIAIDANNNILLTGFYTANVAVTLRDANGTSQVNSLYTLPITTLQAAFLIKYNSSGIVQWATIVDGEFNDSSNDVCVDNNGYIFITGTLANTASTHNATVIKNADGNSQINSAITLPSFSGIGIPASFLIKYTTNGIAKSAVQIHGASGFGLSHVTTNFVYLGGSITSSAITTLTNGQDATQVNSAFTLPSTSNVAKGFLVKYNYNNL